MSKSDTGLVFGLGCLAVLGLLVLGFIITTTLVFVAWSLLVPVFGLPAASWPGSAGIAIVLWLLSGLFSRAR